MGRTVQGDTGLSQERKVDGFCSSQLCEACTKEGDCSQGSLKNLTFLHREHLKVTLCRGGRGSSSARPSPAAQRSWQALPL